MLDGPLVMGYESKTAGGQCVYGIYSVRKRVFIYSAFVKYASWKHCCHKFCKKNILHWVCQVREQIQNSNKNVNSRFNAGYKENIKNIKRRFIF